MKKGRQCMLMHESCVSQMCIGVYGSVLVQN